MTEYIGLYRLFSIIGNRYRPPIIFQIIGRLFKSEVNVKKFDVESPFPFAGFPATDNKFECLQNERYI